MDLTRQDCERLHRKNAGKVCWLEGLAANDARIVLRNDTEILHAFMESGYDCEEQAQAARLCSGINMQRSHFLPAPWRARLK